MASKFFNANTDTTLGGENTSDTAVSSQKAVKTYIDNREIADLSDVTITSPTNNQGLIYNSTSLEWENGNISAEVDGTTLQFTGAYTSDTVANKDLSNLSSTGEAHFANPSLSNLNSTGKSYVSRLGMPSSTYVDLTSLSSGQSYTAPANGWFTFWINETGRQANWNNNGLCQGIGLSGYGYGNTIPVLKNQTPVLWHDVNTLSNLHIRFFYAQGEI